MIRIRVKIYFFILFSLIILLFFCSINIYKKEKEISKLKKNRFDFYVLSSNLEQKHSDFNYLVNQYIINDYKEYEGYFKPFIGIKTFSTIERKRDNLLKKLEFNHNNYSISDLETNKYVNFLEDIQFSEVLYKRVKKAQAFAIRVLKLNIEALNIYHGLEKNNLDEYTVKVKMDKQKAISILYSEKFKILNKEIQKTISSILDDIEILMSQTILEKKEKQSVMYKFAMALLFLIAIVILVGIYYSNNNIIKPLTKIISWTKSIENGVYNLEKTNILQNEIGILMSSFYKMSKKIKEDIYLLEKISLTDPLTQLYNRRALDTKIEDMFNAFERYETPFSVVLIDIDYFKKVNDTYGHDVGDSVLKEFATILIDNIRTVDVAGRWGGEEFLILCSNTKHIDVKILAENLRKKIENYNFKTVGKKTASFGTYEIKKGMSISQLIEKVDEALYSSKDNGRNQVT